jgi:hypothetical protein
VRIGVTWSTLDKRLVGAFLGHLKPRLNIRKRYDYDLWISSGIDIGVDWEDEILAELGERGFAMPLVSPDWIDSDFVREKEWPIARTKILLPVGLVPLDLAPGALSSEIPAKQIYRLNGQTWFSQAKGAQAQRDFVDGFVAALERRLDRITASDGSPR